MINVMTQVTTSLHIDVKKPLFQELLELAQNLNEDKVYADFPKEDRQNSESRKASFIRKVHTAQRIVYPTLHQKRIYEIRSKYGIPTIKGFSSESEETQGSTQHGIGGDIKGNLIFTPLSQKEQALSGDGAFKVWEKQLNKKQFKNDISGTFSEIAKNLSVSKLAWLDFFEAFVIFGSINISYEKPYSQAIKETFKGNIKVHLDSDTPIKEHYSNIREITKLIKGNKPKEASYNAELYLKIAEHRGLTDQQIAEKIAGCSYKDVQNNRQAMQKRPEWKC